MCPDRVIVSLEGRYLGVRSGEPWGSGLLTYTAHCELREKKEKRKKKKEKRKKKKELGKRKGKGKKKNSLDLGLTLTFSFLFFGFGCVLIFGSPHPHSPIPPFSAFVILLSSVLSLRHTPSVRPLFLTTDSTPQTIGPRMH
ncbi:hypothetical protein BDZ94DRAFT_740604 [Collybia nuda]|uniref:Uncharacterized protein n=1 Tax=Collybia nuda TaxID=64659 RepID=A0A9P5Y4Q0_9AGAR|nr:hypothetical protein BDZ94DRAFT_740604 [Collybia nuda]